MHIGALVRAAGPAPAYDDFLDSIRARLHYVPRYRQRLVYPPAATGRPLWADDADFNLEYHVRHTALPAPGSDEQLMNLAARVFSQQLDRSKPLWELWLVEGLAGGGFTLLSKSHHAMIDGIAASTSARSSSTSVPRGARPRRASSRGCLTPRRPRWTCSARASPG